MTLAAVIGLIGINILNKGLKKFKGEYKRMHDVCIKALADRYALKFGLSASMCGNAEIEEIVADGNNSLPYFSVYRMALGEKFPVKIFYYNPDDPDDRDYKRICAEEVAEMLNENP